MSGNSRRGLTESDFLSQRTLDNSVANGKCRFALGRQSAEHRFDVAGVKFVKLLDILDDICHLRRVKLDLGVRDLEMCQFCNLSNVHRILVQSSKFQVPSSESKE